MKHSLRLQTAVLILTSLLGLAVSAKVAFATGTGGCQAGPYGVPGGPVIGWHCTQGSCPAPSCVNTPPPNLGSQVQPNTSGYAGCICSPGPYAPDCIMELHWTADAAGYVSWATACSFSPPTCTAPQTCQTASHKPLTQWTVLLQCACR